MTISLVAFTPPDPEDGPLYVNPALVSAILPGGEYGATVIVMSDRQYTVSESLTEAVHMLRTGGDLDYELRQALDLYRNGPVAEKITSYTFYPRWLEEMMGAGNGKAAETGG